jgi:starvation-inducible DNA-binding protein
MIGALLADHETLIRRLRTDQETAADEYKDIGTNDFLTGLLQIHEKMAWMLRSFSTGGDAPHRIRRNRRREGFSTGSRATF